MTDGQTALGGLAAALGWTEERVVTELVSMFGPALIEMQTTREYASPTSICWLTDYSIVRYNGLKMV